MLTGLCALAAACVATPARAADPATLTHRYSFTNVDYSTITDSVGGPSWNGSVRGTAVLGVPDGVLTLDGAAGSMGVLPSGLLQGLNAVTVETWASFGAIPNWVNLFCFGDTSGTVGAKYLDFCPHSGSGDMRAIISDANPGYSHEQGAFKTGNLDNQSNVHIVVTCDSDGHTIAFYINGALTGINTNMTIGLSNVTDVLNYIGHSGYTGDPYMTGSVDEFRIYSGVLTASQIAIDTAAGPNKIVTDPGALVSVSLGCTNLLINNSEPANLTGNFANVAGVNLINYGPVTFSSSKTNVATVSAAGIIKALAAGSTVITGSYGGKTTTKTIIVSAANTVLAHRYSFNDATANYTAADSVGGVSYAGTMYGNAMVQDGQLVLDGSGTASSGDISYMSLPGGMISGYKAVTFETWVTLPLKTTWARLLSFNSQVNGAGATYLELIPRNGGGNLDLSLVGHDSVSPGIGGDSNVVHVTAVVDPYSDYMAVYVNDQLVSSQTGISSALLSTINDVNGWVGRSAWDGDLPLTANIDELRIYNGALTPAQIAVNNAAGPTNIISSVGTFQKATLAIGSTNLSVYETTQVRLQGDFANVKGVNLFLYANPPLAPVSSDTNVFQVSTGGVVNAVGPGQATLSLVYNGVEYKGTISVTSSNAVLTHRYSFSDAADSQTVADSVGGADGTIKGGATLNGSGQITLDGLTGYVQLPASLIAGSSNVTVETWASFPTISTWANLFCFGDTDAGNLGSRYLSFCPHSGGGDSRVVISDADPGYNHEEGAFLPGFLDNYSNLHITVVCDPTVKALLLYTNGVLAAANNNIDIPLSSVTDVLNYIGHSGYTGDPYMAGTIDEFRIYNGSETAAQIMAHYKLGPDYLSTPATLSAVLNGNQIVISWPDSFTAKLYSTAVLGAAAQWAEETATQVHDGNRFTVTLSASGQSKYFRLLVQ